MIRRSLSIMLALSLLGSVAGCAGHIPAHRWGDLAHPTMTANEMSNGLDGHVRSVSEGATGTLGGAGGGCGCN